MAVVSVVAPERPGERGVVRTAEEAAAMGGRKKADLEDPPGREAAGVEARRQLIVAHLPLVVSMARK